MDIEKIEEVIAKQRDKPFHFLRRRDAGLDGRQKREGAIMIQISTFLPKCAKAMPPAHKKRDARFMDIPLLGSVVYSLGRASVTSGSIVNQEVQQILQLHHAIVVQVIRAIVNFWQTLVVQITPIGSRSAK